jgi:ATP-dependent helicase Lhr and Lhr-like helicase
MPMSLFSQPTQDWFARYLGSPTPVQEAGWPAIASGNDVLVSAPTGTGKTLTAFLYFLDRLAQAAKEGRLENHLQIVYLSPLKALGNDIRENLQRPLEGLGLKGMIRTAVRTGDTTAAERRRMLNTPPHILITTPESLYLLLTANSGRCMLKSARCVIVDELHALLDSKRGAHLSISLERLDALCGRRLQRIALSATVRPLSGAADFLTGGRGAVIIAPDVKKAMDIRVDLPCDDIRALPEKSIWPALAARAHALSLQVRTTLAFVDGRAQAEKLAHGVNAVAGTLYARTHHGCISKEQRLEAETLLRAGELRMLCATSSMELGIDVGDIGLVLQIGAPLSIASVLQRAGRAGHSPGEISRMEIFPKTEADALACGLAARGALDGMIEHARIPELCLDVLAQHLVSMAAAETLTVGDALAMVNGAWGYRNLDIETIKSVLRMLAGDYEHSRDIPVRPRVLYDRVHATIAGDEYTRMLALSSGGTIPDRGWYAAVLEDGTRLGELDEEFVFEARLGDTFLLGAFAWRIREITKDRVIVTPAPTVGAQTPFWKGDGKGRPIETGKYYGGLLRGLESAAQAGKLIPALTRLALTDSAAQAAGRYIARQMAATGCLPDDRTILVEHFKDDAGEHQVMIHSLFGKRVNHALGMLLRREAERQTGFDALGYDDDDGILLYLMGGQDIPEGLVEAINPETAETLVKAMLPAEPLFFMSYRYAAARALMMGMRKGSRQPLWVQRLRGAESLASAINDPAHPLIREAARECMDDLMDARGLREILYELRAGKIAVREVRTDTPSPMALPLRRQAEADQMYDYAPIPSAAVRLAGLAADAAPDTEAVRQRYLPRVSLDSAEALHTLLMTEGDLVPGEADAPLEWLEELARDRRALYIEPGLWIAEEQRELYASGLEDAAKESLARIFRRCLRFRGAQDAGSLADRYLVGADLCGEVLSALEAEGIAMRYLEGWIHRDIYESAQRLTLTIRRGEVRTAPPERFADLLARQAAAAGSPAEQLEKALAGLAGVWLSAEQWEDAILPARVAGYRPGLLDEALAAGRYKYVLAPRKGAMALCFLPNEAFDPDRYTDVPETLTEPEMRILAALEQYGAQFDHALSARTGIVSADETLQRLAEMGLVSRDSFAPVRRALSHDGTRRRAHRGAAAGRWERARALLPLTALRQLDMAFVQCPILCRETCAMPWAEALEHLRRMEYTAQARRGYFVRGLSGAQFVRARDYTRFTAFLAAGSADFRCLGADDPAQAWGRYLKHAPGREFMCVPGTAVITLGGQVAAIAERRGESLRITDETHARGAIKAFADAFREGRIYHGSSRIVVKKPGAPLGELLAAEGFHREMLDYTLYR